MSRKSWLIVVLMLAFSLGACAQTTQPPQEQATAPLASAPPPPAEWAQSGWQDGPGQQAVGGHAGYFFASGLAIQADGSLALSRVDAAAATFDKDLNGDGYKDIIVANSGNYEFIESPFAQIRKQNEDHSMPSAQIYWGGSSGYDPQRTTGLPGDRPSSLAVMDFNLDGILDIAMAGGGEFHPPYVNSRVYWGDRNGYSEQHYTALPTNAATGAAAADFNKDGYPDVIFANLGDYHFPFPPSLIYWGGPKGFEPQNRTELETHGVGGLDIADINNDGWLDIAVGNSAGFPPIDELLDYGQDYAWPDSYVYLGGQNGFSKERRIELPTKGATSVKTADFNKDGYLDLIFGNAGSFALPPLPDTYIYWGGAQGYTTNRRTDLHTNGASAVSIADLNKDGWLDLSLSVTGTYLYIGKPKFPDSLVYWGGPEGFSENRRLALPTEASQGNTIADLNGDGILDILFSQLGDFNQPYRPVLIYYGTGDPQAFYTSARTATLPGQISYGAIVVGAPDGGDYMSHGDRAIPAYDQPDAYVREGRLISSIYAAERQPAWTELTYTAEAPQGTKATLVMEHSADGSIWAESGRIELQNGRHTVALAAAGVQLAPTMRYQLILTSSDGRMTPSVSMVHFR